MSRPSWRWSLAFALTALALHLVPIWNRAEGQGRGGRGRGAAAAGGENGLGALHFRALGPEGNRVASVTGEPGNPQVVYAGAADGGIWKTTDGGTNWSPIFDNQDVSAI